MSESATMTALRTLESADVTSTGSVGCGELLAQARVIRGWVDAFEAQVTSRMRALHDAEGAAPAADQHTRCGGVSAAEGKRKERRSETLDDAPSFADALAGGEIGAEHVDALANATAKLDDDARHDLFALEADLLDDARSMSPDTFGRSCRELARRLERDRGLERNRRQRRETSLSRRLNAQTGMIEGRFAFHPELANQIFGSVDREVAAMVAEGERAGDPEFIRRTVDRNRLAAEALGRLVAAGHQQRRPIEADITLIASAEAVIRGDLGEHDVCETADGLDVPVPSLQRLLCQARITVITVDGIGTALDAGRTVRTANRVQRRALRAMYRTCAFGDCDMPFERCEIHHIIPWELGGPTDLHNLIPVCSRHHHHVHEHGWTLELAADRTLTVRQPDGRVFTICDPDVPPQRRRQRHRRRTAA